MNRTRACHSWNTKIIHPRKCKTSEFGTNDSESAECMLDFGAAKHEGDVALFSRSAAFLPPLAEIDATNSSLVKTSNSPFNPFASMIMKRTVKRPVPACERSIYTCGNSILYTITGRYDYNGQWTDFQIPGTPDRPVYQLFDKLSGKYRNLFIADWFGNDQQPESWLLTINRIPNTDGKFQFYAFHEKTETNNINAQCPAQEVSPLPGNWRLGWNAEPVRFVSGFMEEASDNTQQITCGRPVTPPQIPGVTEKLNNLRIVGGTQSKANTYPWQVALFHREQFCGGVLIAPNMVATAAHCVYDFQTELSVVVGAHDFGGKSAGEQTICVAGKPIVHENWDPMHPEKGHDIALLRLAWPAKLNEHVQPLCLDQTAPSPGTACVATGWGYTSSSSTQRQSPNKLHQLPMIIEDCYWSDQVDSLICAKGSSNATSQGAYGTTCVGDSGGPLACYNDGFWSLSGLVSFGLGNAEAGSVCGWQDTPSVFTRVSAYADWIKDAIDEEMGTDAEWSDWGVWKSCTDGVQSRFRSCSGEKGYCMGDDSEQQFCEDVVVDTIGSCSSEPYPCHGRATCKDIPAKRGREARIACKCSRGWSGNGFHCERIGGDPYCPWPLTLNSEFNSKGRAFSVPSDNSLKFSAECQSGNENEICSIGCNDKTAKPNLNALSCRCKKNKCYWNPTSKTGRSVSQLQCTKEAVESKPKCNIDLERSVGKPMLSIIKVLKKNLQRSNRNFDVNSLVFGYSYSTSSVSNVMSGAWEASFGKSHEMGSSFEMNVVLGNQVVPAAVATCTCTGKGRKQRCGYYYQLLNTKNKAKLMRKFPKWNHINKSAKLLDTFNQVVRG
jgi:chymotrypsin